MARIDIPFVVDKQIITQPTNTMLVSGGRNYFYATFTVYDVWEKLFNLKAIFIRDDISVLVNLIKTENGYECEIPWEVMADKGSFMVGVFGGDRLTTNYAYVIVKKGCVTEGESPKPPSEDWFNIMEEELSGTEKTANKVCEITDDATDDTYPSAKAVRKVVEEYVNERVSEETQIIQSDIDGIQKQILEESHFRGYLSTNAKIQSLEATPNDFAYSAESGTKWVYDAENGWQDTGMPVPDQLTPASDTTPLMNGEASVGKEESYARGDHRHPTDTTRVSVTEFNDFKLELETSLNNIITKYGLDGVNV